MRRSAAVALGLSLAALGAAYWLPAGGVPALECRFRRWTGWPCPTCGYTRGVQAVLRGQWGRAARDCPAAFGVTMGLGGAALAGAAALLRGRPVAIPVEPAVRRRRLRQAGWVALGVLLANWMWRLVHHLV